MGLTWKELQIDFEPERGALIDVYILGTTLDDWNAFLAFATSFAPCLYRVDGEASKLPAAAAEIFADQEHSKCLSIDFDGIRANCHFFVEGEIELDLDPRKIGSEEKFESVKRFIAALSESLNRTAIVTPENSQTDVILSYDPLSKTWRDRPQGR